MKILKRILLVIGITVAIFAAAFAISLGLNLLFHALSPVGLIIAGVIFVLGIAAFVYSQVVRFAR